MKSVVPFNFDKIKRDKVLFGASPPAVFVGRYGYPNISMGPMIPIDDVFLKESPKLQIKDTSILDLSELWFGKEVDEIITYRTAMVRSNFKMNVKMNRTKHNEGSQNIEQIWEKLPNKERRLLDSSQELAMSKISVDTETELSKLRITSSSGSVSFS